MNLPKSEIIFRNLVNFIDDAKDLAPKVNPSYLRMCLNSVAEHYDFELTDIAYEQICKDIETSKNRVDDDVLKSVDPNSITTTAFDEFLADDEF